MLDITTNLTNPANKPFHKFFYDKCNISLCVFLIKENYLFIRAEEQIILQYQLYIDNEHNLPMHFLWLEVSLLHR